MIHTKAHSAEGFTSDGRVIEAMAERAIPCDWQSSTVSIVQQPTIAEVTLVSPNGNEHIARFDYRDCALNLALWWENKFREILSNVTQ